ncbi:MAG: hypothetical protein K5895_02095 [Lachnospiraceae bacterium]|nr:hypothetical protein [Lachnospiraceae bacterium]
MLNDIQFRTRMINEKNALMLLNTRRSVLEIQPTSLDLTEYRITINAPSYIIGPNNIPVLSNGPHILIMTVERDYPYICEDSYERNQHKPKIRFEDPNKRLTHVNVFPSGTICTGDYFNPQYHDLTYLVNKAMFAISFTPETIGYTSMADATWEKWMKEMQKKNKFPTFQWPFIGQKANEIRFNFH